MVNRRINVFVLCGKAGVGKTTFAASNWEKHILLNCSDPRNGLTTTWLLENALTETFGEGDYGPDEIINKLRDAVRNGYVVIFDCAEQIQETLLKTIINTVIFVDNATLVFTFDIPEMSLFDDKIFGLLMDWDIIPFNESIENFVAPPEVIDSVIAENLPNGGQRMWEELREYSAGNFNMLKKLIYLINRNKQNDCERVSTDVTSTYFHSVVEDIFSEQPEDLFDVFKKSSVIGKIFQSHILESPDGFRISGVRAYLDELETMNVLIRKYLSQDIYEFNPDGMHDGVLNCIGPKEKKEWEKILQNYYITKLKSEESDPERIEYLCKLKKLSQSLGNQETVFSANRNLLYLYIKDSDDEKVCTISKELLDYCQDKDAHRQLCRLLAFHNAKLNIKLGYDLAALEALNLIRNAYPNYKNRYLSYYYAKCLYNCGNTDESYCETVNLVEQLKQTSAKSVESQLIYALAYSLLATIQHHFGIDDKGIHYYRLALNHAKKQTKDETVYYEILKKCDMYHDYQKAQDELAQCIEFFDETGNRFEAAQVRMNLATEMMFNDNDAFDEAKQYLKRAISVFESNNPNMRLAYAKNNLAIHYVLSSNNINKAVELFEEALLVGMSSFTYMTIYLNLCMCYLKLYGSNDERFKDSYGKFEENCNKIKGRENATQYEDIYKALVDLIVSEYAGETAKVTNSAKKLLDEGVPPFFVPIVSDIFQRNGGNDLVKMEYSDNSALYGGLNRNRVFLAEFRFWE